MKTLRLVNGDLVLGSGGYVSVDGPAKVRQDLGCASAEPYGNDRFHPRWGSLLDRYIGMADPDEAEALIRSEITRVIQNYISMQHYVLSQDRTQGRPTRFSAGELVNKVTRLDVAQRFDRYTVAVGILTFANQEVILAGTVRN